MKSMTVLHDSGGIWLNILGLVASGRKLGNSEILAKEMLGTLAGEKRLLRLSELSVEPCRACYACLPSGKPCIIRDDLAFFLEQIEWADVVVIASPCYFLGSHTSIKLIGDRLISILNDGKRFQGKRCVAAVSYGVADWEGYAREAVMNFACFLHLDLMGTLVVRAANPGEVVQSEILAEARALAGKLVEGSDHSCQQQEAHTCQGCGSSLLQITPAGQVRCVMCGMTGQLAVEANGFALTFNPPEHSRFSSHGMAEHGQRLEDIKQEYIARRKDLLALRKQYQEQDEWWIRPPR
ncbi:MAG: NADPH-dependent reductase [Anaerosporomusa subterranea]|jgi:multimeric flavodoxin WrbA|nr:NADPH-dependent reductase [Anaerosporomusa subterranea]